MAEQFGTYYTYAVDRFEEGGPRKAYWEAEWQPLLSSPAYKRAAERYAGEHGMKRYSFLFAFATIPRVLYAASIQDARQLILQGLS